MLVVVGYITAILGHMTVQLYFAARNLRFLLPLTYVFTVTANSCPLGPLKLFLACLKNCNLFKIYHSKYRPKLCKNLRASLL